MGTTQRENQDKPHSGVLNRFSRFVETTAVVHETPLAPLSTGGEGHATILFIFTPYSERSSFPLPPCTQGGRGGSAPIDFWRLAFRQGFSTNRKTRFSQGELATPYRMASTLFGGGRRPLP